MVSWGFPLDKGMKLEVEVAGYDQMLWAEPLGPYMFVLTTPPTHDFEEIRGQLATMKVNMFVARGLK